MPCIHPTAVVESGAILGDDVEIGPLAVVGPGYPFDPVEDPLHHVGEDGHEDFALIRRHERAHIPTDQQVMLGAMETVRCGIGIEHDTVEILHKDGIGRVLEQLPEALLAFLEDLFGLLALGDVKDQGANSPWLSIGSFDGEKGIDEMTNDSRVFGYPRTEFMIETRFTRF